MVCSTCTLLHPYGTTICSQCGTPMCGRLTLAGISLAERAPTWIGAFSGAALLACLATTVALPAVAAQALEVGSYLGILSVTNMWLSVYRAEHRDWLQGVRGFLFSMVLTVSLAGDLARILGMNELRLPAIGTGSSLVPVPSIFTMDVIAALLIVVDPLIVRPLIQWVADGAEYASPEPESAPEP